MSANNTSTLVCKCGKTYKTQQPYLKHLRTCQNKSENITCTLASDNNEKSDNSPTDNEPSNEPPRRHIEPDPEYLEHVNNEMKNDLQEFMNSKRPLPTYEPIPGETVTVNTRVIETLLKTVLSQVLLHHHKHTQNIVDQNTKLIEENKMLLRMLRTIIYNNNNIKYEVDVQSNNDDSDSDSESKDNHKTTHENAANKADAESS